MEKMLELNEIAAKIKKLLDQERYNEIYKLCDREDLKDNSRFQSLKLIALMRDGKYEEALDYVEKILEEKDNQDLEEKRIILIQTLYGTTEALKECNKKENEGKKLIQYRKAKILYDLNRFEETLELCEKYQSDDPEHFVGNKFAALKKKTIKTINNRNNPIDSIEAILLTKIYTGHITKEEIDNSILDDWNKLIIYLAYYERTNKAMGLKLIKEEKEKYKECPDKMRKLNDFYSRFNSKKTKLMDVAKYEELLKCKINFDYALKLNEEYTKEIVPVEKEEKVIEPLRIENKKSKKETKKKKMVGVVGNNINNRYRESNMNNINVTNIENNKENIVLIKDYFKVEVEALKLHLYARMADANIRPSALKAYDGLESLSNKNINDKESLKRFIKILEEIDKIKNISVVVDKEKIQKVLK